MKKNMFKRKYWSIFNKSDFKDVENETAVINQKRSDFSNMCSLAVNFTICRVSDVCFQSTLQICWTAQLFSRLGNVTGKTHNRKTHV
jgi:hypothetical protein